MTGEIVSPWCLKLLRAAGEWSREELSEATGASTQALRDWEDGKEPLSRATLEGLVAALHLTEEDTVTLGAAMPRARPWRSSGSDLSAAEMSAIEHLAAQVGRELQSELLARSPAGRPSSDALPSGSLPGLAGIVRSAWGRYFLGMLVQEGEEWEAVWHPRPEDRVEGEELWSRLERFPARERLLLVDASPEFSHWSLCERICLQSAELAEEDLRQAHGLAELALRIATRVPGEDDWRARLKGFALAHLGNVRQAQGDLDGAAEALREARRLWDAGASGDPGLLDGSILPFFEMCLFGDEESPGESAGR
ncbi:MAG TPA: hypothetical protein DD490_22900 [Acidobacteria bacterium]|nr:hypothetical protein [Acidobacteriota bacterium]